MICYVCGDPTHKANKGAKRAFIAPHDWHREKVKRGEIQASQILMVGTQVPGPGGGEQDPDAATQVS